MTLDDQKASKKFVCASELARVFKSMIGLFLTTSFLFLNMRNDNGLMMEDENYDDFPSDELLSANGEVIDNQIAT